MEEEKARSANLGDVHAHTNVHRLIRHKMEREKKNHAICDLLRACRASATNTMVAADVPFRSPLHRKWKATRRFHVGKVGASFGNGKCLSFFPEMCVSGSLKV